MNDKQIVELIGGLNKEGVEAFNAYVNYLYFTSIAELITLVVVVGVVMFGFYKISVKIGEL